MQVIVWEKRQFIDVMAVVPTEDKTKTHIKLASAMFDTQIVTSLSLRAKRHELLTVGLSQECRPFLAWGL